ncbi:Zinc finger protein 367like [Caligus rogercresseyi]|uniref:Zinc finger protein 367like n=1 Tax=Caligus rogercresseyi TaxID=217165 RepID=A0A7T8GLV4_CALRO|nr:Zinc finger protein 367like [Caligus rogercresseyi]
MILGSGVDPVRTSSLISSWRDLPLRAGSSAASAHGSSQRKVTPSNNHSRLSFIHSSFMRRMH